MTFKEFEEYLLSEQCFLNHDVLIIDQKQYQHCVNKLSSKVDFSEYQGLMSRHLAEGVVTIKIEQMEKYWPYEDRTIHVFYSPKNGPTFPEHSDPTDVMIECKDGVKWMEIEGEEISLKPSETILIPKRTFHKALNYEKALMASHGIGDTASLERIH